MDLNKVFDELHRLKADVQFTYQVVDGKLVNYYVIRVYNYVTSDFSLEGCLIKIEKWLRDKDKELDGDEEDED